MEFVQIGRDRYLFVDMFLSGDEVVLISSPYIDIDINYSEISISYMNTTISPTTIDVSRERIGNFFEHSAIVRFKDSRLRTLTRLVVSISYEGNYHTKTIVRHNANFNLVMMTMIKNNGHLLDAWIDYYKALGVEHFYIYHNNDDNIYSVSAKFSNDLVTFVRWDYDFWIDYSGKRYHHAQILAINSAINRCREGTEWMCLFDLDEYVYCANLPEILRKYEALDPSELFFRNAWATTTADHHRLNLRNLLDSSIVCDKEPITYPHLSKNIVRPQNIRNFGIHRSHSVFRGLAIDSNHYFLHFHEFSEKNRPGPLIKKPISVQLPIKRGKDSRNN